MIPLDVPTGNDSQTVQEYYDHLYEIYLSRLGETWTLQWNLFGWTALYIIILTAIFYVYTRWQRGTKSPNEPYPVESYDGHISEMNGPIGPFLWLFFIGMFGWVMLLMVLHITGGQVY